MNAARREAVKERLFEAIGTMRRACHEAERAVNDNRIGPLMKVERVCHALAWGRANAQSAIGSAFADCNTAMRKGAQ